MSEMEPSENKIITHSGLFENEIGPGVVQYMDKKTEKLQEYKLHKPCATVKVLIMSF